MRCAKLPLRLETKHRLIRTDKFVGSLWTDETVSQLRGTIRVSDSPVRNIVAARRLWTLLP